MWTREVFGTDVYHLVSAFIVYSILGWFVESVYMSICSKKLVNRGFGKGPFCPIYGFGAVTGYLVLHPLSGNYFLLYLSGAVLATIFEFLVGKLMLKIFGQVWWDYNDKPCNYKGIICLESTIAWGFYAIIVITFLQGKIIDFIDRYDYRLGINMCKIALLIVIVDYAFRFIHIFDINLREQKDKVIEKYQSFKARWY